MKVKILTHLYSMSEKEFKKLLAVAKGQVAFGIYAVKKDDYAELRNDIFSSRSQLKQAIREFKTQGFKVYSNG